MLNMLKIAEAVVRKQEAGEVLSVGRKLGRAFGLICMSGMWILWCSPEDSSQILPPVCL